jgi:peptidyl-prolyl cis-trans isomerase C
MTACSTNELQTEQPAIKPDSETGQVIAAIGDKKLNLEQLEWISQRRGGLPSSPRALHRLVEYWIDAELLSREAEKLGLQNKKSVQFTVDFAIKEAYSNAMIEHIRETTEVTEQDILDYYEENKTFSSLIKDPPRFSFTHIRTKTLDAAQDALERILQGEDINELARELSVYHDAQRGGTVENLIERAVKNGYGPEFLKALEAASAGQLLGPIKTKNDFYEVARLDGKRAARIRPLEEVKEQLRSNLLYRFQNRRIEEQLDALKEQTNAKNLYEPGMTLTPSSSQSN